MKWKIAIFTGALWCAALPGLAQETAPESPQDYAWGRSLTTTASSPWYRVALPDDVYQQSVWPDLRDVRVFNHQGERVPFTLQVQQEAQPAPKEQALRLFPLAASPVEKLSDSGERVWLRSPEGYEIKLEGERINTMGESYLLALPDNVQRQNVTQLQLSWDKPAVNWQGKASLYYSSDMKEWDLMQADAPLMDVASGSDRLTLNTINITLSMVTNTPRYLLLVFDKPQLPVTLTRAVVIENPQSTEITNVALPAAGRALSQDKALYHWASPQPVTSISLSLEEEGTLPVEIAWRSGADEAWRPLTKTVLWNLNNQISEPIPVTVGNVQEIQVTTVNAHLPKVVPQLTGLRPGQTLIFNAQGSGPYILAWGNKAAQSVATDLDALIPAALRQKHAPESLPEAWVGDEVKLGGEARLSAISPIEQRSQWLTGLVWAALVLGVLALAWMALRIWREVKEKA